MASARPRGAVRGKLDQAGRLIEADPELEALQRDAGASIGQQLAVPQLAAIARLARDLGTPVSRPALAASADEDIDLWVSVRPVDGDALELSLEQWRARPASGPRLEQLVASTDSDVGDALAPLEWSADDELRIISLSGDFARLVGLDPEAAAGMPLTRLVQLEENDEGDMPAPLMVSSHKVRTPVAFVDLESPLLRDRYGINIKGPLARTPMWRELSLQVYNFVVANPGSVVPIAGVTYETQHRGGSGRNFAVYDRFKDLALERGASVPLDYEQLRKDVGGVR